MRLLRVMDIYNFIWGTLFNFDQYIDLSMGVIDECREYNQRLGLFITSRKCQVYNNSEAQTITSVSHCGDSGGRDMS